MLVTHLRSGADAFTLDRNNATLAIDDSHETATDNFLDSAERNETSKENDSLEVDTELAVKSNPVGVIPATLDLAQQSTAPTAAHQEPADHLLVDSDYSWEDLIEDVAKMDRTERPVESQPTGVAQLVVDHDDSIEDVLENLAAQRILENTQTVGGVVAHQQDVPAADDFSLEDYADLVNPDAIRLTATNFHHLPDTLFTHPKSDDWFLVKHFMDDHYVWELGDELAKEYFWTPVKDSGAL